MPPPPRRRRPVQPATRVRLPRTARPHGEAAGEEASELTPGGPANGVAAVGNHDAAQGNAVAVAPAEPEVSPEAGTGEVAEDSAAGNAEAAGAHPREPLLLPVCLGIVAVALGGLAVWFGLKAGGNPTAAAGFGAGTGNAAVANRAATAQVNGQIDKAVDTIFSYNYADTARTESAAKALLTGPASAQYATLFKVVQQQAPKEKLVLTTTVTNSGVEMLNGGTARLLIFANQKDTGATKGSTTEAGAMFAVTAVKQNGQWKIENINTFSAPG